MDPQFDFERNLIIVGDGLKSSDLNESDETTSAREFPDFAAPAECSLGAENVATGDRDSAKL